MTAEQSKVFREIQGLLFGCGCRLEKISDDQYRIVRSGSGEVLGSGTLATCRNAAMYMSGSGRFTPEPVAKGPKAYQAGKAMSARLQGKK